MKTKFIGEEKTNKELSEYSDKIIDILKPLNLAEKYKVICVTKEAFEHMIEEMGGIIVKKELEGKEK